MTADEIDEAAYNDTLETAPVLPRSRRSVDAQKARELRDSPEFKRLRKGFREQGARQHNPDGSIGAPCWLDGSDIDYSLKYPHPFSWSLDHAIPVKERPDLLMDVENFRHSHLDCNIGRGTDEPNIDIGKPTEAW